MIPYGHQHIDDEDIRAVVDVLRSEYLTQGPVVPAFERGIAEYCGAKHAIATNSATASLHLACLALGVGPGDIVWTSSITFVASANCALYCGATVEFVDIDPQTYNMSVPRLSDMLEQAAQSGKLPRVVIPVHLCGQPCDMAAIHGLAQRFGFRIIEDASHAIGASYLGEKVGGCKFSDVTVFSFHPVKIITTGEGGMALTNDSRLHRRMQLLRSHGITRDADQMSIAPDGPWYYEQLDLGYNYRMTDIQAALGLSQLAKLENFVNMRRLLAASYDEMLKELPVVCPWQHPDCQSAFHLYVIRLKLTRWPLTHGQIFELLRSRGIGVNLHYIPLYRQPFHRGVARSFSEFPNSEQYYSDALSLPIFPDLDEEQQNRVVSILKDIFSANNLNRKI